MDIHLNYDLRADAYSRPLDTLDVSDPQLYFTDTWYPYFERLRLEDPVHYTPDSPYGPYWAVTKYKDIMKVEVPVGLSVMRGAVNNAVPGIDADCGGECACATCHVYVDPAWLEEIGLPEPDSQEASMLGFAAAAEPNSRLSCQIKMREALDGLVVRLPDGQH